ncbi:twin-arginine translocase subunit TatC [Amnibacterium endophyticum]|uniref:Sec-independent protein translocase protein TatC n=1 Tax=Amnibacterium endophyticum TaxID=2109337 RepID=A0ABW4LH37_9MICO
MPLIEHLLELRRRLMWAALAVLVGAVAGWFVSEWVLNLLALPLRSVGDGEGRLASLNFPSITSAFDVRLEIAIVTGIVLTSPVWLYQIFAFLTPAFTRQEKKYVFGFFFSAVPLFLAGCAAGFLVIPHIVSLMVSLAVGGASLIDAKSYLDFALRLMLAIGVAFVLPVFLVLLNFAGVLTGKAILKAWRVAVLVITLFTAIATPSADVVSMILLAIPMIALYFAAVGVTLTHDRRLAKRNAATLEDAGSL